MDEIMITQDPEVGKWYLSLNYDDCKTLIREKLRNMATSFMAAGYYIRYVRDNQLYQEDGYKNIHEFAADQFGMSPQQVNHCMRINERFSKDGYTPIPQDSYREFSKSQLQEMLYLTDEQLETVTPDMTVKQIREIKKTLDVEREIPEEKTMEPLVEAMEYIDPQEEDDEELLCDGCLNASSLTGNPDQCANCSPEGNNFIAKCIAGKSRSGQCGSAAYCSEPYECCAACKADCNGRCGWLDEPHLEEGLLQEVDMDEGKDCDCDEVSEKTDMQLLTEELTKANKLLDDMLQCFERNDEIVRRQGLIVAALASTLCDMDTGSLGDLVDNDADPPELPMMKNNDQRKAFLDNYQIWPIWFEVPEASEIYHRYDLPDGSSVVTCEYHIWLEWKERYSDEKPDTVRTREYILKPGYHYLHDCLSNRTAVVEHLKEVQKSVRS